METGLKGQPERFARETGGAMPFALIEVRRHLSDEAEVAIMEAVHAALVAAFRIPEADKHVRLVVHEPHRMACPPTRAFPELDTLVTIDCLEGRSVDAKRALYAGIVDRLEVLGIPRDHVTILVRESPPHNWGIGGGKAAADVDLGFDLNV